MHCTMYRISGYEKSKIHLLSKYMYVVRYSRKLRTSKLLLFCVLGSWHQKINNIDLITDKARASRAKVIVLI